MSSVPPGLILLSHEVLSEIDQAQMVQALPEAYQKIPQRQVVSLTRVKASLAELGDFDWITARNTQEAEVKEKLLPVIKEHPDWRIQYFGAAPIPLAMALGFQLSQWTNVDTYQRLHGSAPGWAWPSSEPSASFLDQAQLHQERIPSTGDVVVRVSLSHRVHEDETAGVIAEPLGSVDLAASSPNEDLLRSPQDLDVVEKAFGDVLDWAHRYRPNAMVHVFAAVTVGAAFRMGASINPTIHSDVQTYQYFSSRSPRYQTAFVLQRSAQPEFALTEEDREECKILRRYAFEELEALKSWIGSLQDAPTWIESLFPGQSTEWFSQRIGELDLAKNCTALVESTVDETVSDVDRGFEYEPVHKKWQLGDQFLNALRKRIEAQSDQRLALRLFLLHESLHRGSQHFEESRHIGTFPKVLEELDYQADVWAYLHEAARSRDVDFSGATTFSLRSALITIMERGIDTFWAFVSTMDPSRMEVRRVHRYLIWHWKKLEIERLSEGSPVTEFLRTLAQKPIVEITGADIKVIDDAVCFHLDRVVHAEIAVLAGTRLRRAGHGAGTPVADIFEGFRKRDDSMIVRALRPIVSQFDPD